MLIQYDEFKTQAQITESEVLSKNNESSYLEAYRIAMDDGVISPDERKMLQFQAKAFGISQERVEQIEQKFNRNVQESEED